MSELEEVADYEDEDYAEDEYEISDEKGADPEEMLGKVREMENELENLTKVQLQVEKQINSVSDALDENSMY
jgi:predicted transcriptional regulator